MDGLLREQGFAFEVLPFYERGRALVDEPFPLGASLAARFGRIYIQDRSSMLPPLALNAARPLEGGLVLDMCASPGSKTGLLAQLAGPRGLVLANEPQSERLGVLRQNLAQQSLLNTATCCHPGERLDLPEGHFTHVLLDPPCSGWGTSERHPKVMKLWQGDKVEPLIRLQRDLLRKAASLLAPGGALAYSTCTTNPRENEDQARLALELGLELVPTPAFPGFAFAALDDPALDGCLLVDEELSQAQGFFVAVFRKPGPAADPEPGEPEALPGEALGVEGLAEAGLDPTLLPPGELMAFGQKGYFLHELTRGNLPRALRWQGAPLGKANRGFLRPSPRLWSLIPPEAPGLRLERASELEALFSGRELRLDAPPPGRALFFRDLPLGLARITGARVLWSEGR